MNRLSQNSVGLKRDQLIGVNALTITISRNWISKIREIHGAEPKFIQLATRGSDIYGELIFNSGEMGAKPIRRTGADGKSYSFQLDRNYFRIFPTIRRGKFVKFFSIVELMPNYLSLRWCFPPQERVIELQKRKTGNTTANIKKIDSFIRYLEKVLMFGGFVDLETKSGKINTHIKHMRNFNPLLQGLELL